MTISWTGGSGSYDDASKWTGGVIPGASDDAAITVGGSYTVTLDPTYAPADLNSLNLGASATLAVTNALCLIAPSNAAATTIAGTVNVGAKGIFALSNGQYNNAAPVLTGTVSVDTGGVFQADGTLANYGTVTLKNTGGGDAGEFKTLEGLTLTGGGTIQMQGGALDGDVSSTTLAVNNAGNTIAGYGSLSNMIFDNQGQGVVQAQGGTLTLVTGRSVSNEGRFVAYAGGDLELYDTVFGVTGSSIFANGGRIEARGLVSGGLLSAGGGGTLQFDSEVQSAAVTSSGQNSTVLLSGATMTDGSLTTTNSGRILVTHATLDGNNLLTVDANLTVAEGKTTPSRGLPSYLSDSLTLIGAIKNDSTITLSGTHADTSLLIGNGGATLTGGGSIVLGGSSRDVIAATTQGNVLDNAGNTIEGGGRLGNGTLVLDNEATVRASSTAIALTLALATTATSNNSGTYEADLGADLEVTAGTLDNSGTVLANGGTIKVGSAVQLTNDSGNVLSGGVWQVLGETQAATIVLSTGQVKTLAAALLLDGQNATVMTGDGTTQTSIESSLTAVASAGTLTLTNRQYTTGNAIVLDGTIALAQSTLSTGTITGHASSTLQGSGTVASSLIDTGMIEADGTLALTGASSSFTTDFTGKGTIAFSAGTAQLNFGTSLSTANTVVNGATVNLTGNVLVAGTFALQSGTLTLGSGSTLGVQGTSNFSGGTIKGSGKVTNNLQTAFVGAITIGGTATFANAATVSQDGSVAVGDGSGLAQIVNTGLWSISGDQNITFGGGTANFVNDGGDLVKASGTGVSTIAASLVNGTSGKVGSIEVQAGTLTFTGPASSFVSQAIDGIGMFVLGGGASTIGPGTTITSSSFSVTGAGTLVTLAENLSYAGTFSAGTGATLALAGKTLTLNGLSRVVGTISGSGTVAVGGTMDVMGSIAGGAVIQVGSSSHITFESKQSGATLAFGPGTPTVTVASGITFGDAISGFAVGDLIDLKGTAALSTNQTVFTVTASGGTLQILDPTHNSAVVGTLLFSGSQDGGLFTLAGDGTTGTLVGRAATPPLGLVTGDVVEQTSNIAGQPYTGTVYVFDPSGQLVAARYLGVTGQAYQSDETDYSGGHVAGTQYFYSGITGKTYTSETLKVNGAGQQTAVLFGGVTGQPYSAYEYDYAGGLFAGSRFTYTTVPAGATYSSYETDYDFANSYGGAKFFYTNITGQAYTGEEVDTTAAGATTKVLLTGFTGQPYQTLELDYTAGAYSGSKTFATGIKGQNYTGLEQDVTAAGQLTKVVYTGLKNTPYTTLEQDYTNGALSSSTFTFNAPAGQSYSSYLVTQDATGKQISETVNNTNGSHTILGSAPNLIFESIGNDTITGGGSGETFAFHDVFGHDTLTDFYQHASGAGHDTLDLSTADFTSFASLSSTAQTVSGGVMFTGKSGSSITLLGVDKTTLAGLSADFKFHA